MSLFAELFGSKKKEPTPEEAMNKLRETEDMLAKKSEFIEAQIQEQVGIAKKHGLKNKRLALQALKKKRRLEAQQVQIGILLLSLFSFAIISYSDNTLTTIEFQIEALANAATNAQILDNMKGAADALKRAHGNKTAEDVHEMLDELEEANDLANEISDAISRPLGSSAYMVIKKKHRYITRFYKTRMFTFLVR